LGLDFFGKWLGIDVLRLLLVSGCLVCAVVVVVDGVYWWVEWMVCCIVDELVFGFGEELCLGGL